MPLPDIITEAYLELRTVEDDRVVTVLELLSPTNKRPGRGRAEYELKRLVLLGTATHLVEVDLLRAVLYAAGGMGWFDALTHASGLQRSEGHLRWTST